MQLEYFKGSGRMAIDFSDSETEFLYLMKKDTALTGISFDSGIRGEI